MWYNSKKEILEHLGKNGRNTKYVDRMIERGVIVEVGGQYAMRGSKEWEDGCKFKENDLMKREEEFKKKEEGYHAKYKQFQADIIELEEENKKLMEKLEKDDDKVQEEYYKGEYERVEEELRRYRERLPNEIWRWLKMHNVRVNEAEYDDFCEGLSELL